MAKLQCDQILFGGDYNPDSWPLEVVDQDMRLMQKAHVNTVSLGVFSWAQIQPHSDVYDWGWLDRIFDRLEKIGVNVALATPSAAPPRWLTTRHPEIMQVMSSGIRRHHGERQYVCRSSTVYRREVQRMNQALAERYGQRSNLLMWHVSNEYCSYCYCPLCAENFRLWLKERYGSLETLNQQYWGAFWSHRFSQWEEVIPPFDDCATVPLGLSLDWKRFQNDLTVDFFKQEIEVLRGQTPQIPVTTNLMCMFEPLNYASFADAMDIVSQDVYGEVGSDPAQLAMYYAYTRGLKPGQPWLLLEQAPGVTNWHAYPKVKPPKLMRLWSWQALAHGSNSVMFFQWRRSRGGYEKFHSAFVGHAGKENARIFKECAQLGLELQQASQALLKTRCVQAKVGVLWDSENRWALNGSCGPGRDKDPFDYCFAHFKAIWKMNIPVDVVRMDADWSQYEVLIAPTLYMIKSGQYGASTQNEAEKLRTWVRGGGTLVATFLSGIVNESDLVYEGGYPGPLQELLGIWVEEIDVSQPTQQNLILPGSQLEAMEQSAYACERYYDLIQPQTAHVLGVYGQDWYQGKPCVTCNAWGQGQAYYLGTHASPEFLHDFYRIIFEPQGIMPLAMAEKGVEILKREDELTHYLFVLNHTNRQRSVELEEGFDVIGQEACQGGIELSPFEVKCIAVPKTPPMGVLAAGKSFENQYAGS